MPAKSKERHISNLIVEYDVIIQPKPYHLNTRQDEKIVHIENKLQNLYKMLQRQYSGLMKRDLYDYCTICILESYAALLMRSKDKNYPKVVKGIVRHVSSHKINYQRARLLDMHRI